MTLTFTQIEGWKRWGEAPSSKFHYFEKRGGYWWSACGLYGLDYPYLQIAESHENPPIEKKCKLCLKKLSQSIKETRSPTPKVIK